MSKSQVYIDILSSIINLKLELEKLFKYIAESLVKLENSFLYQL